MSIGYGCVWCGWCCTLRPSLCRFCHLCEDCCRCPAPPYPILCPLPCLPPLPCLGPSPPPFRIIREQILVPVPFPVYRDVQCLPQTCYSPCGDYESSCNIIPNTPCRTPCNPFTLSELKRGGWPCHKRIFKAGQALVPGYKGHIPGFRSHGAGRTFGQATRDTCCIMSKWNEDCPKYPCRIFEQ